jgi:hypothetical protein
MARCRKCLLPENVPGAHLDPQGVCEPCRIYAQSNLAQKENERRAYEQDLEKTLQDCRGKGEYDCLLCLSGGKDSIYLLHKLVRDYKLKVLTYTSQFDLPEIALQNIARTVKILKVDHIVDTPSEEFYRRFIRYLLQHQTEKGAVHTVCYFWLDIREGNTLRLAMEKKIPLILTGYAPGQPEPERMVYEMPRKRIAETDWTPEALFKEGLFQESERKIFWNPFQYPKEASFPRLLAPFHAWKYNQSEAMDSVVRLGLIPSRKHANPLFSNFTLNWLFMYSDLKNLGYNPYIPEFAQLIREGKANFHLWRVLAPLVDFMIRRKILLGSQVREGLRWTGLKPEDLKIGSSK